MLSTAGINKGDGFPATERVALGVEGLLPPAQRTLEQQMRVVLANLEQKASAIEKYIFLRHLLACNQVLFYYTLTHNIDLLMPIVYTPVVGEACIKYSDLIFPHTGVFLPHTEKDHFLRLLSNWPERDIRVIVVTDGERILGLGDLAANGMGIPVGKLSLYSACAGIHPRYTLPVTIDMGTNNDKLLNNPNYIGLKQRRIKGEAFDQVMEAFVKAATTLYPRVLIQWEDFGNTNAFRLLDKYRSSVCSFNDDIQGTACVALSGLITACRLAKRDFASQRFLFLGAGEAGVGIGDLIAYYLFKTGLFPSLQAARQVIFFVDSQGLVCRSRSDLAHHKLPYAHDIPFIATFAEAVNTLKPTAIIGVSTQPQTFTQPIIETMARLNERPVIFALSNPTSKSECTAEQAYTWSDGRAIFASGSPFDTVTYKDHVFHPGQGNNSYVFPGIGLGVIASEAATVSEDVFLTAAAALSAQVTDRHLAEGLVYPPLSDIRSVSFKIGVAVAEHAFKTGVARAATDLSPHDLVARYFFEPVYSPITASL